MGLSGISPLSLLIILAIVLVLFGGRRLRNLGTDLGGAIKGFRSAVKDADRPEEGQPAPAVEERSSNDAQQR